MVTELLELLLSGATKAPLYLMAPRTLESPWMNDDLRMFRKSVHEFIEKEFTPHHVERCYAGANKIMKEVTGSSL